MRTFLTKMHQNAFGSRPDPRGSLIATLGPLTMRQAFEAQRGRELGWWAASRLENIWDQKKGKEGRGEGRKKGGKGGKEGNVDVPSSVGESTALQQQNRGFVRWMRHAGGSRFFLPDHHEGRLLLPHRSLWNFSKQNWIGLLSYFCFWSTVFYCSPVAAKFQWRTLRCPRYIRCDRWWQRFRHFSCWRLSRRHDRNRR